MDLELLANGIDALGSGAWGFVAAAVIYAVIEVLRGKVPFSEYTFAAPWIDKSAAQGIALLLSVCLAIVVSIADSAPEAAVAFVTAWMGSMGMHDGIETLGERIKAFAEQLKAGKK